MLLQYTVIECSTKAKKKLPLQVSPAFHSVAARTWQFYNLQSSLPYFTFLLYRDAHGLRFNEQT